MHILLGRIGKQRAEQHNIPAGILYRLSHRLAQAVLTAKMMSSTGKKPKKL